MVWRSWLAPRLAALAGLMLVQGLAVLGPAAAGTLEDVRARGHILCGVGGERPGFAAADERGQWSGIEADYCRAMAAAVLGSKAAVKFVMLTEGARFEALAAGQVDVLSGASAWTLSRDTEFGVRFAGALFYDGQGFLVRRADAFTSVLELSGSTVCVQSSTSATEGLTDFFKSRQMKVQPLVAEQWKGAVKAYEAESCMALSGDVSTLAHERTRFASPADHVILPELITKAPLGPAVRQGDEVWFAIARWVLMAIIAAEEHALTSQNVDAGRAAPLVDVRRLLGVETTLGQGLGLAPDWVFQIVSQVGNYGEMFDRTVGARSALRLDRGINNLWTKGGLMFAVPFR